jgi:hypothetical protein
MRLDELPPHLTVSTLNRSPERRTTSAVGSRSVCGRAVRPVRWIPTPIAEGTRCSAQARVALLYSCRRTRLSRHPRVWVAVRHARQAANRWLHRPVTSIGTVDASAGNHSSTPLEQRHVRMGSSLKPRMVSGCAALRAWDNQGMKIMTAAAVTTRALVLFMVSWLLVGLATPTPDPFVVSLGWLVMTVLVLTVPVTRRVMFRWVSTGRLRRIPA